jgi:hypothetical protein
MKRLLLIIIMIIGFNAYVKAQLKLDTLIKAGQEQDSSYVFHYPHKLSVKTYLSFRSFSLKISDPDGFGNSIVYKPNTPMRLGVVVGYKGVRMGLSFPLPSFYPDRGYTKNFGFFINTQTSIFSWGFDFYFLRTKGFFMANPELNIPNWDDSQTEPFRPDIKTINAGIATHVVFSRKFSLKAATQQTEKQLRNAGGIALDLAIKYTGLWNDSTIIPISQQPYYPDITNYQKGGFLTLSLAPGYAYTYVLKDWYSTTLAYLGAGLQTQSYKNDNKRQWAMKIQPKFKFMQIIGYNIDKYYANISFTYETNLVKINDTRFNSSYINFNIGGGMRFK